MKQSPPKLALLFFRWYCHPKLQDYIEGDLLEVYTKRLNKSGKRIADIRFTIDVVLLLRPGIIRPIEGSQNLNNYGMYKSYFKIGWRNLVKEKGYSFINIGGLALGMAVAILIGMWVYDELNFNKNFSGYSNIARVLRNGTLNGETHTHPSQPYALAEELKTKHGNNFKRVAAAWPIGDHTVSTGELEKLVLRGEFIEPEGAEMFSLNMIEGSRTALRNQNSILLSQSTARALFGDQSALEKTVKVDNTMDARVAGVYEDFPHNSRLHNVKFFAPLDLLISVSQWIKYQGFTNNFLEIYVELEDNIDAATASDRIKNVILDNVKDDKNYVTVNPQLFLHPMEKWHLWSDWKNGQNTGLIQIVWLFGIVGVFVLLLACINFMNLSTARSEKRAKEVGIRKTIGSKRAQLIAQFFSESLLVASLAFFFSLAFVSVSLGLFNDLAGKQMSIPWTSLYFWIGCIGSILFTGLLAGSYPALYLSSFNVVRVMKGSLLLGRLAAIPRKILVVVQFTVSVTLIIGTLLVYKQISFAKDRPIGYDRNNLLMVPITSPEFQGKYNVLQTELKNTGAVAEMATSSSPVTDIWNSNGGFDWKGKDPAFIAEFATFTVTPEYGQTVGWQFVSGRNFSRDLASDSAAFVINESAARILGLADPLGEVVQWQSWWTSGRMNFTIVGVIKDQVVKSPYDAPMPSVYFLGGGVNWINIRVNPQTSLTDALPKIKSVFKKVVPSMAFDYKFADQEYALKFAKEERIGVLAIVFAGLAIIISCLGLFGLASFVSEQRTKEIGIRKVVGASVFNLWRMLSKDFVVLVIISCLVAIPIAYYFLTGWLAGFTYRTDLPWWIFALSSAGVIVITLLTVSYQAIRAASMNPVRSLRSE